MLSSPCFTAWPIPARCADGCVTRAICVLPHELHGTIPGTLCGCTYKLTRGGAGQEPGADPLPPLLPPPGVDTAKVVSLSSTMVPAVSTGLTRSQPRVPKHDGEPYGPQERASVRRWIWHSLSTAAAVSWCSAGMTLGFPSEPPLLSSSSFQHRRSSGALGPGFALGLGGRQEAGISPGFASDVTCTW